MILSLPVAECSEVADLVAPEASPTVTHFLPSFSG